MALKYWESVGSNDWDTAANWTGAALPTSSDDVVFTSDKSNVSVDGLTTTNVPDNCYIDPSYTGDIGSSGTYVTFSGATVALLSIKGLGKYYFSVTSGTAHEITTAMVDVNGKAADQVNLDCGANGTIPSVIMLRGLLNVVSGFSGTTLYVAYGDNASADAVVEIEASVTLATVEQAGGRITCASALTTALNMEGGFFETTAGNIPTININGGGQFVTKADGPTYGTINVRNGRADFSQEGKEKTITNSNVYPRGVLDLRSGSAAATLTLTNNPKKFGDGRVLQTASSFAVDAF